MATAFYKSVMLQYETQKAFVLQLPKYLLKKIGPDNIYQSVLLCVFF